jgi:esterase
MNLFFRKLGEGPAIIVLHGVFGSSDNLYTVCKQISEKGYSVYTLDARNHGQSPRSSEFNYDVMADDLNDFLEQQGLVEPIILGHSMGGKTVMQFAMKYSNFSKLIIVDIAPKFYPTHHSHILEGLNAIKLDQLKSRKDAETIFSTYVSDLGEQQFILKNLYRKDSGEFDWRINIPVITNEIYQIGSELNAVKKINKPALFIKGSESSYITDEDEGTIKSIFTDAEILSIEGANHWVHATKPLEFINAVIDFIN